MKDEQTLQFATDPPSLQKSHLCAGVEKLTAIRRSLERISRLSGQVHHFFLCWPGFPIPNLDIKNISCRVIRGDLTSEIVTICWTRPATIFTYGTSWKLCKTSLTSPRIKELVKLFPLSNWWSGLDIWMIWEERASMSPRECSVGWTLMISSPVISFLSTRVLEFVSESTEERDRALEDVSKSECADGFVFEIGVAFEVAVGRP